MSMGQPAGESTVMTAAKSSEAATVSAQKVWTDGTYTVDKDLPSGLYRVTLTTGDKAMGIAYIERSNDTATSFQDIIANSLFHGDAYVQILPSDTAVKVHGCSLTKVDLTALVPDLRSEFDDGIHLVGYDIAPGIYSVTLTDNVVNMGYVVRLAGLTMSFREPLAYEIYKGPGYVEILPEDFAVQIGGARLVQVE